MTIKSLLLGSTAALVAVSGARAADAIVAPEPEAVEYVKVCDTYGAGYFYIPGTETCLSINGYLRTDFRTSNPSGSRTRSEVVTTTPGTVDGVEVPTALNTDVTNGRVATPGHTASFDYRARINFDARTETELGTLRSLIRIQGENGTGDAVDGTPVIDQALIQLGGFSVGYTESFWVSNTWGLPGVDNWDDNYGYHQTGLIGYEYAADGWSFGLSAEFDFDDSADSIAYTTATVVDAAGVATGATAIVVDAAGNPVGRRVNRSTSWYRPNFVARVKYEGAWGAVLALGAYDNEVNEFAVKVGGELNLDFITEGALIRAQGTWDFGGDFNSTTKYSDGEEWDFLIGYTQPLTDTLSGAIGYTAVDEFSDGDIVANLTWTPVTGFDVIGEARYRLADQNEGVDTLLRLRRSF